MELIMYYLGIRAFLAIVKNKNLKEAAESIFISPSTISYRLKILERQLGKKLIERNKGQSIICLTNEGKNFISIAERWENISSETELFKKQDTTININISAPNSLNLFMLPALYRELYRYKPDVHFRIHTEHTEESVESVIKKEMDIAFLVREVSIPDYLMLDPFMDEPFVLLRLNPNKQPCNSVADAELLQPEHELYWRWGNSYQIWHDKLWGMNYRKKIQLDMAELIPEMLVDTKQWAIVAHTVGCWIMEHYPNKFIVQYIEPAPPNRVCYKLTHRFPTADAIRRISIINQCLERIFPKIKKA